VGGVVVNDSQNFCDRGLTCVDSTPTNCPAYWCQQCTCTHPADACGGNADCAAGEMCDDGYQCGAVQTDWCLDVERFARGSCPSGPERCS
jgi:hypothetical protein